MGTELVNWQEQMAKQAVAAAKLERPSVSAISLRGGIMKYGETPIPGNKLPCVIVGSVFENRYYDKPFDPNKPATPACFSLSLTGEEMAPHEASPDIQNEVCASCPQFQWASDPKGGKGKACKQVRKLAVIPAGALKDGTVAKAEIAIISIPVMSVKFWKTYVNQLAAEYSRPAWGMLTEIRTENDARSQFVVKFDALGVVSDDGVLGDLFKRSEQANALLMTPYEAIEEAPVTTAHDIPAKTSKKY